MKRRLWFVALITGLSACSPHAAPTTPAMSFALDPGPLRDVGTLSFDFQWRQHVTARWPDGTQGFDAVLMKRGGELTLVGLSPMGMPGFVLTLDARGELHLENRTGAPLPFPPRYVLADVQRVFFPWLAPVASGFEGERTGRVDGLSLRERYVAGRLVERHFRRDDAPDHGEVSIRYEGYQAGDDAPSRVVLDNGWFRYTLTIDTLEQSRL